MSYSLNYIIKLGPANSGLNLQATLYDTNSNIVAGPVSSGFTELINGEYQWYYTTFPNDYRGRVRITDVSGNYQTSLAVNPEEAEYVDEKLSSLPSVQDIDTYLTGQHGSGAWNVSTATLGTYEINFYTLDEDSEPIGGSTVSVYGSGTTNLLGFSTSNMSTGKTIFNLDPGDYQISTYNAGVANWNNPYYYTVASGASVTLQGTRFAIPVAPTGDMVRLYVYTADIGLGTRSGIDLSVYPSGQITLGSTTLVTGTHITASSDDSGYIYVDVAKSAPINVKIPQAKYERLFITPTSGTLNLATI